MFEELSKVMILKKRATLGWQEGDDRNLTLSNRIITLSHRDGKRMIAYEPDPRHAELLVKSFGLDDSRARGVSTPGEKSGDYYDETELEGERIRLYRSATMTLGYVAQDVP